LNSTIEKLEGTRVRLTVTHTADEIGDAIADAYVRVARKTKLPGFRPGKAPRPIIDAQVGRDSVLAEALKELIERDYPKVLDEHRLSPIGRPDPGTLDGLAEGEDYTYHTEVDVRPELTISSIEGLKAVVPPSTTSDAEIDAQIEYLRDRFATLEVVEDRGIEDGDFTLISFSGTVDGESAEDLTVDKYLYEVGRGIMPPQFDEGLKGAETGTTLHIEFPVPETAANTEYVGKVAAFEVEVHEIKAKALPAVDDELASNIGGFETIAELREDIRTKLDENKAMAHTRLVERGARDSLIERLEGEIPEEITTTRMNSVTEEFFDSLREQGMSIEEYTEATGITREGLRDEIWREAASRVRDDFALEALFRQAGLEYTDEELDSEIEKLATTEKVPVASMREQLVDTGVMALLRERLMHRHAMSWLLDHVEVVEETPATETPEPAAKPKKKAAAKKSPKKSGDAAKKE
jgi:trigger factor